MGMRRGGSGSRSGEWSGRTSRSGRGRRGGVRGGGGGVWIRWAAEVKAHDNRSNPTLPSQEERRGEREEERRECQRKRREGEIDNTRGENKEGPHPRRICQQQRQSICPKNR